MNPFRVIAIVLIVLGALMLASPMLSYKTTDKVLDVGPLEVTKQETHRIPVPPIVGGVAIAAGLALLFAGSRKAA
jgi:hypothetical protein